MKLRVLLLVRVWCRIQNVCCDSDGIKEKFMLLVSANCGLQKLLTPEDYFTSA